MAIARDLWVDRKLADRIKRDDLKGPLVRRFENNPWSHIVVVGLLPACGAQTPAVAGLEPSNAFRVQFTAQDMAGGSVVEAAVEEVAVKEEVAEVAAETPAATDPTCSQPDDNHQHPPPPILT